MKNWSRLRRMHEAACECGVNMLLEKNRIMSFFLLPRGKELIGVPTPWTSPEQKPGYIAAIRNVLKEYQIDAYCFVTEAWVATVNPRTQRELMDIAPSERSDREDALMIMSRNRSGESYATKYVVTYDEQGKVSLGKGELLGGESAGGLMGNLFEERIN